MRHFVFEAHREKKAREAAEAAALQVQAQKAAALKEWNEQMQELRFLLAVASGQSPSGITALILKKGELGVAQITNVGLIEDARAPDNGKELRRVCRSDWAHRWQPVRYRVSGSRGHYVQGAPVPTAWTAERSPLPINASCTKVRRRQPSALSPSCSAFSTELRPVHFSLQSSEAHGRHFGTSLDDWVSNRLSIAMALFNGDAGEVATQLKSQIAELEAAKPVG